MQHDVIQKKILLIEDNDIDVEMIKRLIKRSPLDFPIVRARNGVDALKILESPNEHGLLHYIILLDINMPLMNGFELLEHMAKNGPNLEVPIYMLSTSDSESDILQSKQYKISGYLIKPLTSDNLSDITTDS